jgi:hypothetical protein
MKKELNYTGIFKELNKKKIKYIVCGGLAVNLLGIPRMTYDIDLLVDMDDRNVEKLLNLLKKWGFGPKLPVGIMDFADKQIRQSWIKKKHMKAFNVYNSNWAISEIDILIDVPVDYKKASKRASYKKIDNIKVPLIAVKDLIKMKEEAGRKQDKADIRYLKELI